MEVTTDDTAGIDVELAKMLITAIVRPARDFCGANWLGLTSWPP